MRSKDRIIFQDAAASLHLWILVRSTNSKSLPYIGQAGYKPKRIDCKAKTADHDYAHYRVAGLVVDPGIHAAAFKPSKLADARLQWQKMKHLIGSTYQVNKNPGSPHYGCLTLQGNHIHGDYDLYDIVDPGQAQRNLALVTEKHGQPHLEGANTRKVMDYVNGRIGTPMIQHSGQAQFSDHSGQSKIDVFGPGGECFTVLNEYSLKDLYATRFNGRKTLAESW
jgi:hypothetical protein